MAKPFLQCHRRFKNGKDHCYWSIAEKVRTHRGWVQRHLLHLGEINNSQKAAWTKTIDVFDTARQQTTELALYPASRAVPDHTTQLVWRSPKHENQKIMEVPPTSQGGVENCRKCLLASTTFSCR